MPPHNGPGDQPRGPADQRRVRLPSTAARRAGARQAGRGLSDAEGCRRIVREQGAKLRRRLRRQRCRLARIAAICRHLDGIPLAIEFAAATAAALGTQTVANSLHDRFSLLTRGRRTAAARHRTLRATLDWSHDLLTEAEQRLLRRLAVFPAAFTLDAVLAVMSDTGLDRSSVADAVANLVAKSLITLDKSGSPTRWRLLETIRAYASEQLARHGETDVPRGNLHHPPAVNDRFSDDIATTPRSPRHVG